MPSISPVLGFLVVSETDSSIFDFLDVSFLAIVVFPAPDGEEIQSKHLFFLLLAKTI